MIWFVFFGIVLGLEEGLHIGITLLVSKFPKKAAYIVEVIVNIFIMILAVLYAWFGYGMVQTLINTGATRPVTGLPDAIFFLPVVLTGILMIFVTIGKLAEQFVNRKEMQE